MISMLSHFVTVIMGVSNKMNAPVRDGLPMIYEKLRNVDGVILFIPTYGGNASALYYCWSERSQGIFPQIDEAKKFYAGKVFAIVVVGNVGNVKGVTCFFLMVTFFFSVIKSGKVPS